jgi:hypothetical protein
LLLAGVERRKKTDPSRSSLVSAGLSKRFFMERAPG